VFKNKNTMLMNDNDDDIASKLLRINSRFKQVNETNTDFTFLYAGANLVRMQLVKFSCCRMFPNVYPPYNTLNVDGTVYTIPNGQYTAKELAEYITASIGIECTLSATSYFQLPSISGVLAPTKLSSMLMGFAATNISMPAVATSTPSLQGPDPIYIESNDLALSNCFDHDNSNSGSIPLVWSVNCSNVPFGYNIGWESNDAELNRIDIKDSTISNRTFAIKLTDKFGHVLILPENQHVDMKFKVFYERNR
jgi:hypothetical protein